MTSESPKIERVKLKDLPAMAARFIDGAKPSTFIPITKHRAEAMLHNPNADPDDVAMLLATVGERCVGYFGVMAVMLQYEGKLHKVHWLTTWAVAPDFVGTGLGSRLMEEALALDVDLAIVGSKPARRVSAKYGFQEVKTLDYVEIDFGIAARYNPISLGLRLLRKLFSYVGIKLTIEPISNAFDVLFGFTYGWLVRRRAIEWGIMAVADEFAALKMERVDSADGEKVATGSGFVRDERVVSWMLSNPWVAQGDKSESSQLNYVFSDARTEFEISAWKVSVEGKHQGFVCFQQSTVRARRILKVLDHQLPQRVLLAAVLERAAEAKAAVLEGPVELAEPLGNSLLAGVLVRRKQRTLQVHPRSTDSPLGRAWRQLEQTYVDGDTAFT